MTRSLENLNRIAKPFLRGAVFVLVNRGSLKMYLPNEMQLRRQSPFLTATLTGQRNWFRHRNIARRLGLGGTDEQTLCQLILWYRGQPRLPGYVLKNWQERNRDFCKALDEIAYDDASSTLCVLCGKKPTGLDWWSLGSVTGPSCRFGECREGSKKK